MSKRLLVAAAFLLVIAGAAGCAGEGPGGGSRPLVVATTTIVGDLVRNVAGDQAQVEVLMPPGADPHEYQASARQAGLVHDADLIVTSGLGLEQGLSSLITAARGEGAQVLELGPALDPLSWQAETTGSVPGAGSPQQRGLDPHWWLDPVRARQAVKLIAARLQALSPGGGWQQRATHYAAKLRALDTSVRDLAAKVPQGRRKLVTLHAALGYFAARYGFTVIGVVIPGGSTEAQPSAEHIAGLAARIRDEGVPVIFGETTLPTQMADSLAREAGPGVTVVQLYTGSLGQPGSAAGTYLGMITTDAQRIANALA